MAEKSINFVFTPTKTDYVKSMQSYYSRQKSVWSIATFLGIICLCTISYTVSRGVGIGIGLLIPILVFAFYLLSLFLIQPLLLGRQIDANERLRTETEWVVNESEILVISRPHTETKYDWGSFCEFIETKDYFLILHSINKRMFQVVPRRAFQSSDQENEFRAMLENHFGKIDKGSSKKKSRWYIALPLVGCGTVIFTFLCLLLYSYLNAPNK